MGCLIEEGLFETRVRLFQLKMIVLSPRKELECEVQKLGHIKLEVIYPKIKNKSERPAHDCTGISPHEVLQS